MRLIRKSNCTKNQDRYEANWNGTIHDTDRPAKAPLEFLLSALFYSGKLTSNPSSKMLRLLNYTAMTSCGYEDCKPEGDWFGKRCLMICMQWRAQCSVCHDVHAQGVDDF